MTTITWKDNAENTCVLTIADGQTEVTTLDAGADPFVTSIDESDEIFKPIRTTSGNIGVNIDSVDDIVSLVGRSPITTPVTLTVNGSVRWVGFLSCESFSQEWDRGPIDVSLPVMSGLEVLNGIHYPYTDMSDLGYISFAQFLLNLNTALGSIYTDFYFPNISDPSTTLAYIFRMSNYATSDDKNTTYEMATYYDILEDICKLFGWQAIEYCTALVFMAADVKDIESGSNFNGYDVAELTKVANGQTATPTTPTFNEVVPEFFGVDHRRSFVAGKNKVDVVGQLNEEAEDIWSMDVVEQCVYKGHDSEYIDGRYYEIKKFASYQSDGAANPNGNILAYNSMVQMFCDTQYGYNIKFEKFKNNIGAYGGCIAFERTYSYNSGEIAEGDREFTMRLITKGMDTSIQNALTIHTNYYYTPTQNTTDRFYIKGSVLVADEADDVFVKQSGILYCRVVFSIGNLYYDGENWQTTLHSIVMMVKDGEVYAFKKEGALVFFSYIEAPNNMSGEVIVRLCSTKLDPSDEGPGDKYIAYENLSVKLVTYSNRWKYIEDKSIRGGVNENKVQLNNGFTDEWSQSCGLTLARESVADSTGVVLKSDKTYPTSLYDGKWPEAALCDRVAAYAAQARMVLFAIVKGDGAMLSPLKYYAMQENGRPWICLCQTMNWKTNEISAGFFEPSYSTLLE